jgi:hypothetical protein
LGIGSVNCTVAADPGLIALEQLLPSDAFVHEIANELTFGTLLDDAYVTIFHPALEPFTVSPVGAFQGSVKS